MPTATRRPPKIVEIGVEHWAEGKGNIKAFLLGGPDVGKTRWASAFPRPVFLACESVETVAASIATRKIAYAEGLRPPHVIDINSTNDMLDAIEYLRQVRVKAAPGSLPKYQTAVVDTFDGFGRTVKDEWSSAQADGIFGGRDAWGYLEAKQNMVLTRLLALDMNVLILCHLQEKTTGEGDNKVITYQPFLQGQVKDSIFHDFNLVGFMDFQWEASEGERTRRRAITYEPSPKYPFLKDHFHLTPPGDDKLGRRYWPVTLDDGTKGGTGTLETFAEINYGVLAETIFAGMDGLADSSDVEQLPDSTGPSPDGVAPPGRGGPVAGAPAAPPAKKTAAPAKKTAAPAKATEAPAPAAEAPASPPAAPAEAQAPVVAPAQPAPAADAATASTAAVATAPSEGDTAGAVAVDPASPAPESAEVPAEVTPAEPATAVQETSGAEVAPAAESDQTAEPAPVAELDAAVAVAQEALGAEVVTEAAPVDATGETAAANPCPVCGCDLSKESADLMGLSRLKHRDVVVADGRTIYDTEGCCFACYQVLNNEKATKTGHYAESA